MKNLDIREALKNANMRHWVLADELGIDESTLTRWLRQELPTDKKERIIKIIESYKQVLFKYCMKINKILATVFLLKE